jgi:hypothetical protein
MNAETIHGRLAATFPQWMAQAGSPGFSDLGAFPFVGWSMIVNKLPSAHLRIVCHRSENSWMN